MRHIHVLPDEKVPRDDEFKFRERAKVLVDKWHDIAKTNGASDSAKPATNGTRKAISSEWIRQSEANCILTLCSL